MNNKNELRKIRDLTFIYAILLIVLMGAFIFIFLISPLGKNFIKVEKNKFYTLADSKREVLELYIDKYRDIAKQIASRTRIRQKLEEYEIGKISLRELIDFTGPKLEDAMNQAKEVKGIARFAKDGEFILNVGTSIPRRFFTKINTDDIWISHPFKIGNNYYIVLSSPLIDRNSRRVGTDLILFDIQAIKNLIYASSRAFPLLSFGLGTIQDKKVRFFFIYLKNKNEEKILKESLEEAKDLKKPKIEIISIRPLKSHFVYYAPIKYTDWVLVSSINRATLFVPVYKIMKRSVYGILFFILLTILGIVYLFYPFIQKVIKRYEELREEMHIKSLRLLEEMQKRERLEESYDMSVSLLNTIFDTIPLPIVIKDVEEKKYVLVNKAFSDLVGKDVKDVIDKTAFDLWDKDNAASFEEMDDKVLKEKSMIVYEDYLRVPGEKELYGIIIKSPFFDRKNNPIGVVSTFFDLTERRKMEKELSRLATLVEQASEYIVITDPEGIIEYVNPAFTRITGYEREEVIGKTPRVLKSGKHSREFYRDFWDTLKRGDTWRGEFINRKKSGEEYYDRTVAFPIKDKDGNIINFGAIKQDITEEKIREKRFAQAEKMNTIGRLTGGIAHDFNNLLTVILGYSDFIINASLDNPMINKYAKKIQETGEMAKDLTSKLLAFGRRQLYEPKVLDINIQIKGLEKMLLRLIPENIELQVALGEDLPFIYADPIQIEQVIMNLVLNARDALMEKEKVLKTSYKKIITIESAKRHLDSKYVKAHPGSYIGEFILISVSDNGIGMDQKTIDKVFEPFFTTKEQGRGTGLGLSTVYGIIKQNNGMIYVYSEPLEGTTFKVYWPVTSREKEGNMRDEEVLIDNDVSYNDKCILVAEDNNDVRFFIVNTLKKLGARIYEARNGKEALEILEDKNVKPDLLIADVIMPEMNGEELSRKIKDIYPSVKILFISGYTQNHITHEGMIKEGVNFLHKPFSSTELISWMQKILG